MDKLKNAGRMLEWTEKRVKESGLLFVEMGGCRELQVLLSIKEFAYCDRNTLHIYWLLVG